MMYCLRSYIPLLLLPLPLSLSPIHLSTLLVLTYLLNRPCIYCSLLLIILFASSCHWSGKCFWAPPIQEACSGAASSLTTGANSTSSIPADWMAYFIPRLYTTASPCLTGLDNSSDGIMAAFMSEITNSTISGLVNAAKDSAGSLLRAGSQRTAGATLSEQIASGSNGIGTQWLKNLLGRSEWTLPCVDVKIVI